ncbi:hypothetical protein HZA38_04565 [Candidatus Peregrinibacteria bacterium]|nr:hypothetical protein [Candidatus Peregrinibacteria bacterium]
MNKIVLLEIRRQVAHLCFGIVLSVLIFHKIIDAWFLAATSCTFAAFVCYWKSKYGQKSYIKRILAFFERDEHILKFPGRGIFFFIVSAFLVVAIFPREIALASILILSVGDSISHIYGRFLGKWKIPCWPEKNVDGHVIAVILSALTATAFVPFLPALLASLLAMIVEIPRIYFFKHPIDDNLLIPLVASGVLSLWNVFSPFL